LFAARVLCTKPPAAAAAAAAAAALLPLARAADSFFLRSSCARATSRASRYARHVAQVTLRASRCTSDVTRATLRASRHTRVFGDNLQDGGGKGPGLPAPCVCGRHRHARIEARYICEMKQPTLEHSKAGGGTYKHRNTWRQGGRKRAGQDT
jgi:hypothetical protein